VIIEVKIPNLPESVPDATLLDWTKSPGDAVAEDEILIELETDKIVLEVPSPVSGVVTEIVKATGETGVSQEVIARIDTEGVATNAPDPVQADAQEQAAPASDAGSADAPSAGPAARKLMAEKGVDPASIKPTGPGGRITKADVLAHGDDSAPASEPVAPGPGSAAPAPPSAPALSQASASKPVRAPAAPGSREERRVPMTRLRQRIAERLVDAQHTAAILTTFNEVNMGPVMALRKRLRDDFEKSHGTRLGFMSFFAKAAVQALQKFPAVNAYIEGTETVFHDFIDIGVAVGSPRGLVVPVLRNVEGMSFADIEAGIADFGQRAQAGKLGLDDLSGGTFTISNGGVFGSMLSTPILNPPQSGILGMHKTQDRPVVENGEIVIRPIMYLALSYDHRIIDGREAVQFLVTIKECIEDPARLLLEI
jgi:2-oxoglutarate dehydrogenase E2 component (dihydrolipoamide succinyltransferase)